jgi:hypothetical protein
MLSCSKWPWYTRQRYHSFEKRARRGPGIDRRGEVMDKYAEFIRRSSSSSKVTAVMKVRYIVNEDSDFWGFWKNATLYVVFRGRGKPTIVPFLASISER